jgi:DNA-binding HxlR family transcriptional regulator
MLILRDIAFLQFNRFNQMINTIPGLTPRVLSMRLKELESDGIIEKVPHPGYPLRVEWRLTEKGKDVMPILMSFIGFGSKWYPERVFKDGRPRTVPQLFPKAAKLAEPPKIRQRTNSD